jgi:hypothetical protein
VRDSTANVIIATVLSLLVGTGVGFFWCASYAGTRHKPCDDGQIPVPSLEETKTCKSGITINGPAECRTDVRRWSVTCVDEGRP